MKTTDDIKKEIHQYIDRADNRFIQLIYGMIQADLVEDDFELSDAHKKILNERLKLHEADPDSGENWNTVKTRIASKA